MKQTKSFWFCCFIALILLFSFSSFAYKVKGGKATLDSLVVVAPELRVVETTEDFWAIKEGFVTQEGILKFLSENSGEWVVFVNQRTGVPSLIDGGAIPFIPGPANDLSFSDFGATCESMQCVPKEKVETLAREFLDKYKGLFPVEQGELVMDPNGTFGIGNSIYLLRFQWVIDGIPVENGSIFFRINNGNLIQVASANISAAKIDTNPSFTRETALDILNGYLGSEMITEKDEIIEKGKLIIVPITPKGMDPDTYVGQVGVQNGLSLCYRILFRREGVQGTWEGLIDAHSGEILRFVDANRYGRVHGGVKASDGLPQDEDRPFPYADLGGGLYSDGAGMFSGNNATSTLTGKYAQIQDACGSISNTTTTGDLDFLTDTRTPETDYQDCSVPPGNTAGVGNTKSARTLFYNTTAINLKAQTYNPSNSWLQNNYVILHVNGTSSCNAGSAGLNIYFYKRDISGCPTDQWSCCNNLGEIPGVAMHEWAHSYDTNDGSGGQSPPLETYADWTAIIQTHNSCTGAGFFQDGHGWNCDGYGDACTNCTGIRDCDWAKHTSNTPWTSANHTTGTPSPPTTIWGCSSGSYNGPCGWEDHCESGISSQALWDFVYRDLPAECGLDLTTAWMLEDRLWFAGVATLTASYTCSSGTTNGCSGTVLYSVMRALDDDGDGTANGTPHAHAIYHAMHRHLIDCNTWNDSSPQNQNQTSCPTLNTPTLSATAGSNSVNLSWTSGGANATRYFIYKNESSCDVAFNRIAIVNAPTLTYTDTACANGVTYYYRVQAATDNDSCVSPSSNCVTAMPQPCAGSITLTKTLYNCADTVTVNILDSTAPSSPFTCEAWSTSDSTHRTFQVTGAPSTYTGTFTTTTGAGGPGVVHVSNGDTLYVRYVDPDYCGTPNVNVDATSIIDCVGPVISNVMVTNVTATSARITWTTNEAANSRVTYGSSVPPGTNKDDLTTYGTSHTIDLTGLSTCTQYYFSVTSADGAGNSTTDTNSGNYYTFTTQGMSYALGPFDVESGTTGWTMTGQWHRDNCKSHGGSYAFKAGSTTCPGTYDASTTSDLTTTSSINLGSTGHGYHLKYWEYYETESGYDYCRPQISTDGTTFTTLGTQYAGTGTTWVQKDFDLAAYSGNVWIRFELYTDSSLNYEGWYIDDIEISKSQGCSAELIYQSKVITDACNGTGSGGGNGILEPGEDATIQITLYNNGALGGTGISGTLSCSTPGVSVTDNYAQYPDIPSGGTGTSISNHYAIHIDSSVTCVTTANFTLHTTSNENPAGTDSYFTIDIGQAGGAITDFSENFNSVTTPNLPTGWTRSKTSGNDWATSTNGCTGNALYYPYNSTQAANSWAYTPAISLTTGVTYTLSFNQKVYSASYPEKMEVKCGTSATPSGQTITIMSEQTYTNTTCTLRSYTFTVPTTGNYYIGFHCTSAADMWNLYVDDVLVTHNSVPICNVCTSSCTPPSTPAISNITDNDPCVQNGIAITFTSGSPATRHDLYRDSALVQSNVTSPISYDPGDTSSHSYVIRAVNGNDTCYTDSTSSNFADSGSCPAPGEVGAGSNFVWTGQLMSWNPDANATGYRVYRGVKTNLEALCNSNQDFCRRYEGTNTSLDITSDDPALIDSTNRVLYYLITAYNGGGEGPSGTATCGARQVNASGICP